MCCLYVNLYFCKISCQFWLSVNDLSLWRETRHFDRATKDRTSMQILNRSFEKPIADTPVFVTERNCNFATKKNKTLINKNRSAKLYLCLFSVWFLTWLSSTHPSQDSFQARDFRILRASLTRWLANQISTTRGRRHSYRGFLYWLNLLQ